MAEDLGEKTEDATPKRKADARQEGKVAKSQDLAGVIMLVVATVGIAALGRWMLVDAADVVRSLLDGARIADPIVPEGAARAAEWAGLRALRLAAPVLLVLWTAGLLAHGLQTGWLYAPKALQPKLSKLNPLSGAKRIFGVSGAVKTGLDAGKILVVSAVAVASIWSARAEIASLPYLALGPGLSLIASMALGLALKVLAVLLILAILDYVYQKWKYGEDLKMTKQEVKEEMKQAEGDPEVKRRRMRMQQEIARQRIGAEVPKADVIVTNPEHISIAIKYDAERMNAPRVVAKGADYLALRIRQIAMMHGIPIIERKPLARAMYRQVEVGQEIPPQFYKAVAEILAYVYRLGRRAG